MHWLFYLIRWHPGPEFPSISCVGDGHEVQKRQHPIKNQRVAFSSARQVRSAHSTAMPLNINSSTAALYLLANCGSASVATQLRESGDAVLSRGGGSVRSQDPHPNPPPFRGRERTECVAREIAQALAARALRAYVRVNPSHRTHTPCPPPPPP